MTTALLIIDVQRSLLDEGPWNAQGFLDSVKRLIANARQSGATVVYIRDRRVEPDGTLDASLPQLPADLHVDKDYCDAFLGTELHALLRERAITRLVVCGMQTDYCVDTTCRRAASLGYDVQLASDAHTTVDHEYLSGEQIVRHHNRILRNFRAQAGRVRSLPSEAVRFAQAE